MSSDGGRLTSPHADLDLVVNAADEQRRLSIDVKQLLEDETDWLQNFVPTPNVDHSETDNVLIAGHLKLIRTLLTCHGINKREFGE